MTASDVGPAVDDLTRWRAPGTVGFSATLQGALAGWLVMLYDPHPLVAHCGTVNRVQIHLRCRWRGIGVAS
ncbi:hypothetical protein [Streptomyces zhihengii]|uniref:hypothetical protein n=1 Tax=Streptomyces zhihengii TaxID=1818004 RepID=UPI001FD4027B|nr:hypothetical protein [Streptomyces zhihengii]